MTLSEEEYGSKTREWLLAELRRRKAALWGRKKELIERLIIYDKNNNFGVVPVEEPEKVELIRTPPLELYKDINMSSPIPKLTDKHIHQWMSLFEKNVDIGGGTVMYQNGYLRYLRYCIDKDGSFSPKVPDGHGNLHVKAPLYFVTSKCEAQMKKHVTYDVNISLFLEGEIHEASCECAGGQNKKAHCKHVSITLFGVRDIYAKKEPIVRKTCTQQIQKFHRPTKKYMGSPLTANKMKKFQRNAKNNSKLIEDGDSSSDENEDSRYREYFQNLMKSRGFNSTMTMKHLTMPANTYGVFLVHDYLKYHPEYKMLKDLRLIDVSLAEVEKTELATLDQSGSKEWFLQRKIRITASKFSDICKAEIAERFRTEVRLILEPKKFKSKQTGHGKVYENVVIEQFEKSMLMGQMKVEKCGLMIMQQYPFIGGSLDGILAELTVVEVKCRYPSRYAIANEVTVEYLEKDANGNLALKEDHEYYYQVQGQLMVMMVTGRIFCDFLVYTFKSLIRITVKRNDKFISEMLGKLIKFNNDYLRPASLNKYLYKNYDTLYSDEAHETAKS